MRDLILVTGGAGSIGSETCRALLGAGYRVRAMDVNEEGLWKLSHDLPLVECILGDVQSLDDARVAVKGAESVIHAAAYKHVHLCEKAPRAAKRVNEGGTQVMIKAAGERRFVLVSTDKAISPASVMGRTKLAAEHHTHGAGGVVVRFGNVVGSRGSLVPMVCRCRQLNRPVPLTDPRMTRFFMGIGEAAGLILEALRTDLPMIAPLSPRSARIGEFVSVCRDLYAPGAEIVPTGIRPGERLHEPMILRDGRLLYSNEARLMMSRAEIETMLVETVGEAGRAMEAA